MLLLVLLNVVAAVVIRKTAKTCEIHIVKNEFAIELIRLSWMMSNIWSTHQI